MFVRSEWVQLKRTAFLLCGDRHTAEDLTQTALAKLYARRWTLRSEEAAGAFARTTLVRTWIDWQRKRSASEVPVEELPSVAAEEYGVEQRVVLQAALRALPETQRAVLVLRFWEDLSVEETARILRRRPATVRSDTLRGLEKLRAALKRQEVF